MWLEGSALAQPSRVLAWLSTALAKRARADVHASSMGADLCLNWLMCGCYAAASPSGSFSGQSLGASFSRLARKGKMRKSKQVGAQADLGFL